MVHDQLECPACRNPLDPIAATGRADDLYVCSDCYHSWFRFEIGDDAPLPAHGGVDWEEDASGADLN